MWPLDLLFTWFIYYLLDYSIIDLFFVFVFFHVASFKMMAFDKDTGDNGRLTYTISGSSKFTVDDEGVITTAAEIT